jgi:pSer/pThr/pTyr-binding forkhead associated (FHA) protein
VSFVLQRQTGRGLALTQLHGDALRIGRGTNAELRSENPAVALEHAVIERTASGYVITDKGSITGTYVNGRPVETATLAKGDVVEVGDLRVEVQVAEAGKPLFLRIVPNAGAKVTGDDFEETSPLRATPRGGAVRARKIDYVGAYRLRSPYFTKLTLVAILAIISLAVMAQVTQPDQQAVFMPGGVSSAHARARDAEGQPIARNCAACHDPWRGVSAARCTTCHAKEQHSPLQTAETPCIDCHTEHRASAKLAVMGDGKCVSCHADLPAHESSTQSAPATGSGPAAVSLLIANPGAGRITSFGDLHPEFAPLPDPDTLRFNHALHLKAGGIFNATGAREQLQCTQCHKLVEARGSVDPKPIHFQEDCQRCHRLTFDMRFPDLEVPHGGDPGLVYGFVLAAYAGNKDIAGKSPDEVRRILTSRPRTSTDESAVLNAEQVVKVKCTLCHQIRREGKRLAATPPVIRSSWLQHTKYSHTAHRNISCETCHEARRSTATSDVLMPSRSACTACHGPQASARISSNCVTCHEYHERSHLLLAQRSSGFAKKPPIPEGGLRKAGIAVSDLGGHGMLGTILVWAVILLILVVLLPVGLALYQRVRASDGDAAARPANPPAAPPPTTKVPAMSVPPPAPPPAPESTAPQVRKHPTGEHPTRFDISTPDAGEPPSATVAIQWYGMLRATGGPLEGQTFVIEDEGLYIGRDATLSRVVIPDERISKRHVRVIPRNGKVFAIDQNSTNGTYIGKAGGQRITEVQLKRGDVLVLADNAATFTYQI